MKVRHLKRRVRARVYYEWRQAPRAVIPSESTSGFGVRYPGPYMVASHGFGWRMAWVRPWRRHAP